MYCYEDVVSLAMKCVTIDVSLYYCRVFTLQYKAYFGGGDSQVISNKIIFCSKTLLTTNLFLKLYDCENVSHLF